MRGRTAQRRDGPSNRRRLGRLTDVAEDALGAASLMKSMRRLSVPPLGQSNGTLWNLFRFINPGRFGSLEVFSRCLGIPIEQVGPEPGVDRGSRNHLRQDRRPLILRRPKRKF